jgi:cell division septation protein DedD
MTKLKERLFGLIVVVALGVIFIPMLLENTQNPKSNVLQDVPAASIAKNDVDKVQKPEVLTELKNEKTTKSAVYDESQPIADQTQESKAKQKAKIEEEKAEQAKAELAKEEQAKAEFAKEEQAKAVAKEEQAKAELAKAEQAKAEQQKLANIKLAEAKAASLKHEEDKRRQLEIEKAKAEQAKLEQEKHQLEIAQIEQTKVDKAIVQQKAEIAKTEKSRAEQTKLEQVKAEQAKFIQEKAALARAEQTRLEEQARLAQERRQPQIKQDKREKTQLQRENNSNVAIAKSAAVQKMPVSKVALRHGWVVQMGSFAQPHNASALLSKLRKAGYPAFTRNVHRQGMDLTIVMVGPHANRTDADRLCSTLSMKFQIEGIIVRYEPH